MLDTKFTSVCHRKHYQVDSDFEVEDDATKAQIKKAFTKSLTAKENEQTNLK